MKTVLSQGFTTKEKPLSAATSTRFRTTQIDRDAGNKKCTPSASWQSGRGAKSCDRLGSRAIAAGSGERRRSFGGLLHKLRQEIVRRDSPVGYLGNLCDELSARECLSGFPLRNHPLGGSN